jgi:hypothetical protein
VSDAGGERDGIVVEPDQEGSARRITPIQPSAWFCSPHIAEGASGHSPIVVSRGQVTSWFAGSTRRL